MIVEYDASWPLRFEAAAVELRSASGGAWLVEHIGSTSIEGLAAKPTIDLAVRVDHLSDVDQHSAQLSGLGWFGLAAGPKSHRVLVKQDGDCRTHIAHFFPADQWETCHQRLFRDWLRGHPDDRDRYALVKHEAAESGAAGAAYTAQKTAIVQDIVDRARAAKGLPIVDIHDG